MDAMGGDLIILYNISQLEHFASSFSLDKNNVPDNYELVMNMGKILDAKGTID